MRYGVIMAGGGGTRFWPLSRINTPKQFLHIAGEDTMINNTIKRIKEIVPVDNIMIVANKAQENTLQEAVSEEIKGENILLEPVGRNTAACIGYAAMTIKKRHGDAVMGVFPSDHYIKNVTEFRRILEAAYEIAESTDKLVTIGIKPTFASTGYGYIRYNRDNFISSDGRLAYEVVDFIEKPPFSKAKQYLESGNYLWNSGMFIWKVSVILKSFERFLPKLYRSLMELEPYIDTEEEWSQIEKIYPTMQSISIDYGIMERSDEVVVIPGDFGWSDVGSWDSLGEVFPPDENGNIMRGDIIEIDTRNSVIYTNSHLVAAVGLENMIVVETADALLVCAKERAQDVKRVVDKLKEMGRKELL
ncbi:mannose-1-phosphate guanylyltransferase [Tepidanaerobacter syntrophicus]|uniref:mannose-1-phosphate guanylyltransferase n=1 Tax=Tepidanaerobacter syntrophicus TaxID=224999 RepID=UPI0022EFCB4D|nr:mannose-1-phosphate guanylyltransferase [Tepidanaerobacter syntrophicus]GLI51916.1 mannose-1-phosphate guanylyltransferase [Tepidanaerobacter syntrophicus]